MSKDKTASYKTEAVLFLPEVNYGLPGASKRLTFIYMKYGFLPGLLLCLFSLSGSAQKIDSIYFHLYTDSLKKGVYNYINVDGLLSNGRYLPLDTTQIIFTSTDGKWVGNNLIFEPSFSKEFVTVTARLKSNRAVQKTIAIYLKKRPDDERLKTEEEIMNGTKANGSKRRRN